MDKRIRVGTIHFTVRVGLSVFTRGLSTKVNRLDSQQPQNSDLLNWCQIFILHFELRLMRVLYGIPTNQDSDFPRVPRPEQASGRNPSILSGRGRRRKTNGLSTMDAVWFE